MIIFALAIVAAYLTGSIPTSFLAGKIIRGIDLRNHGSGNLGATNAFRVLGWKTGLAVLFVDIMKGVIPVVFFPLIVFKSGFTGINVQNMALIMGLFAIIGHIFTIFMHFRGGKGVATSIGVFAALAPFAFLIVLPVCVGLIALTRYVSAGSLAGAILLPLSVILIYSDRIPLIMFSVMIGIIIVIRHRANIQRLLKGNENKIF